MHKLVVLVVIFLLSSCSISANILKEQKTGFAQKLDRTVQNVLDRLYGDIEPVEEIFPGLNHPNHIGEENAQHFTNEWVVHIPGGKHNADFVASDAGYENAGQVCKIFRF